MTPLKFGTPFEYAQKFLDAPDDKHPEWTFMDAPIETDFNITPESIAPFAIEILDKMAEIEKTGIVSRIKIKNNSIEVIGAYNKSIEEFMNGPLIRKEIIGFKNIKGL
jgi:hypothetical protein